MSTILVTGATGFIGSHVARALVAKGEDVHILARKNSNMWRIADIVSKISVHTVDVLDQEKLNKVILKIKPEIIYHFASSGLYGGVSISDNELIEVNITGLINLFAALEPVPYKAFINVGSVAEYGMKDKPMKESDLCEPMNGYAISKLAATRYATMIAKIKNKPVATFRVFSPFGEFDDHRRLINKVNLELLAGRDLSLANPNAMRDYMYIGDLTVFFLEAPTKYPQISGEIFNVSVGSQRSIKSTVDEIAKNYDSKSVITWQPEKVMPWESKVWQADMTKTFATFSWRPKVSFEEGIKRTTEWVKKNSELYSKN